MITLVTGNPNKLKEAKMLLGEHLQSTALDLPELQTEDIEEIVRGKVRAAFAELQTPVLVEDVSYSLAACGNFPGTFIKFWEKGGMHEAIQPLLREKGERGATATCCVGYKDADREIIVLGIAKGRHMERSAGEGWGFDYYFMLDGLDQTFAQMGPEEKIKISHRHNAYTQMRAKLLENGISL